MAVAVVRRLELEKSVPDVLTPDNCRESISWASKNWSTPEVSDLGEPSPSTTCNAASSHWQPTELAQHLTIPLHCYYRIHPSSQQAIGSARTSQLNSVTCSMPGQHISHVRIPV